MPFKPTDRVDVIQLGARMHYAVPRLFQQFGTLQSLYTDFWYPHFSRQIPFLPILKMWPGVRSRWQALQARHHPDIPDSKVISCNISGIRYHLRLAKAKSRQDETRAFLDMSTVFQQWVLKNNRKPASHVYCFNTVARDLFKHKKFADTHKILEQTLAPRSSENRILKAEYQRRNLPWPTDNASTFYEALELEEWQLANTIICGSEFVRSELISAGAPARNIRVVPYGVDIHPVAKSTFFTGKNNKLRILFAGNGAIRKGLLYAIEGLRPLGNFIELHVAGNPGLPPEQLPDDSFIHWHKFVPRVKMKELFQNCDVFLLPSLCEGSATVIYEAMAYGLGIICTPNAGSVITDHQEGRIVPICDSTAITHAVEQIRDNPDLLENYHKHALRTAGNYQLRDYGQRLLDALNT